MLTLFPSRPVALEVFGFAVHWYGIMYLLGFLLAYWMLPRLQHKRGLALSSDDWASILAYAVIGVIVGGRVGYVLLYAPEILLTDPLEVIRVWHGGMSSHGGFIGVSLALLYAIRRKNSPALDLADIVVVPIAIGLALGRLGNFINQELYGTVTSLPWGISIPGAQELRHPTQIYAMLKDLLIAAVCLWHLSRVRPIFSGSSCALFLMLYGILRFLVEFLREQQYPPFEVLGFALTRGQVLSLPVFLVGVGLWLWTRRKGKEKSLE